MFNDYWDKQSEFLRKEIKEKYDLFSEAIGVNTVTDSKIIEKINLKNLNDIKAVIEYFHKNESFISNDNGDYQNFFSYDRIPVFSDKINLKKNLTLINALGIQILNYSLYKVKQKSIATYFAFNTFCIENIIEKFKIDFVHYYNDNSFNNDSIIQDFLLHWDEEFVRYANDLYQQNNSI